MLITSENLKDAIDEIVSYRAVALDTETTGLRVWSGDKAFLMTIATEDNQYAFKPEHFKDVLDAIIGADIQVAIHNAKFDLGVLLSEGITLAPENVFCTKVAAILLDNNLLPNQTSLDYQASLHLGVRKSDEVKEYCDTHGLFTVHKVEGKKRPEKMYHFDKVPLDIVIRYAELDAKLCFGLFKIQSERLSKMNANIVELCGKSPASLFKQEMRLSSTLVGMERRGVKIDKQYCVRAYEESFYAYTGAKLDYEKLTGKKFVDSAKSHATVYLGNGIQPPMTEKGNYSFDEEFLEGRDDEISKAILRYRKAYKKAHTYFQNFLQLADRDGFIHCDYNQNVRTGRMSCKNPNLQNLTKDGADELHPIRRAFVPSADYFLMRDYAACEYRMAFDFADEQELIKKVVSGLDIHDATKELMRADSRTIAKMINFMLLYGGGADKLAASLGISRLDAQKLKLTYFENLPNIKRFIYQVIKTAETRGFVVNPYGRVLQYPDKNFCYKAPNGLIQGGTADMMKLAMVELEKYLEPYKSKLILSIHDELIFDMHDSETFLVEHIGRIMESAYKPLNGLGMKSDIDWSDVSLHDRKDWSDFTHGKTTGNEVQGKGSSGLKAALEGDLLQNTATIH